MTSLLVIILSICEVSKIHNCLPFSVFNFTNISIKTENGHISTDLGNSNWQRSFPLAGETPEVCRVNCQATENK